MDSLQGGDGFERHVRILLQHDGFASRFWRSQDRWHQQFCARRNKRSQDTFEYCGTMDVDNLQAAATEPSSSGSPAPAPTPPTENPTPSGLVAAYDFNESSGTSALDASGNGNTRTITGATRTSGKFGSALNFDGKKDLVRINASASLNVSSEVTLEAWVNPAVTQGGWRTILQREAVAYWLHASHDNGNLRPATGGTFNGGEFWFPSPSSIPVNSWSHLALTYDGNLLRLYVNGNVVASRAVTGSIQTNDKPLWIGGSEPFGEFFQGRIDEVRVYNRALSQSEIQTDMETPVGP